jgi:hypothetical protein
MEGPTGSQAGERLEALPADFATTVASLHRVAEDIVAPARKPENEIALRATPGGFGTPPFEFAGEDRQVRVQGDELVYRVGGDERRSRITSIASAGALVAELLPEAAKLDEQPLPVDRQAADALGAWYALGDAVLAELIAVASSEDDPSEINLWPEHFDLAIELGPEGKGARANYGFSPGDADHPEPYLYVGPWTAEVEGRLWNGRGFRGAELGYGELLEADDPKQAAIDFCRTRSQALKEGTSE